ncbi:papilin-like [Anarrhichthys ocellatus]|uniref:papilin-like n=1 Tax=Anarrhichthys ocellatus TaxID=433405 RepID=UPI0012EDF618|nr:papilin-like [Anarrhichthys ocellatus]
MKMRTLLFVVILGLLAVVHSTPVNTVTQLPAKAEDEVFREAVTDGFLVDNFLSTTSALESPETNTTVQASQQPTSDSKESDAIEGSESEASDKSTTPVSLQFGTTTVSHALSSASTVLPRDTDDSSSDSSTTQSPQSSLASVPKEAQPSVTPDHISASQTTDPAVSTFDFLNTLSSDSGSGFQSNDVYFTTTMSSSMISSSNTETSTTSSTSTAALIRRKVPEFLARSEGSGSGSEEEPTLLGEEEMDSIKKKGRMPNFFNDVQASQEKAEHIKPAPIKAGGTPGWMIIIGFIVGLAALVMLFVAIATRDKWNGPSQASQGEDKSNSSNQQRELEMETFLHKDNPKENGHTGEYTVVPLEELSEKHSSH